MCVFYGQKIMAELTEMSLASDRKGLAKFEQTAAYSALRQQLRELEASSSQLRKRVDQLNAEFNLEKEKARQLKAAADAAAPLTEETKALFETLPSTLEELEEHIQEAKARADLNYSTNPKVIEDYERRCRQIESLEQKLATDGEQLEDQRQTIERVRGEWLPPLLALMQRIDVAFGVYFRQVAIAGEVALAEHEDYDKYGVQIKVQFRAHQPAQVLDSFTQSGGERSVSTMLYLMALQDMTHCPFRLVDEINQGMDPTNERLIFEQFSRSASKPNQPQFFMITPKLLPGLKFTPEMTVCCVMNGPHMLPQADWPLR